MEARLDIDEISRRVLRKSWEQWSLAQKKEFKQLFIQHLVGIYWEKVDSGFERIEMGADEAEANIYWHVHTTVLVEKGSVTVDGISLTVADVDEKGFSIAVIPHTAEVTTLGTKAPGDSVNLETDIIGKYVERLLSARTGGEVNVDVLKEHGFA